MADDTETYLGEMCSICETNVHPSNRHAHEKTYCHRAKLLQQREQLRILQAAETTLTVASKIKPNTMTSFVSQTIQATNPSSTDDDGVLASIFSLKVVAIFRYTIDKTFIDTMHETSATGDVYDVLVCDRSHKIKCVLSPKLNTLVVQGSIFPGAQIDVKRCSMRYDESVIPARPMMIILDVDVMTCNFSKMDMPFLPNLSEHQLQKIPLASSRRYYRSLTNDDDCLIDEEKHQPLPLLSSFAKILSTDHPMLKEVIRSNQKHPLIGLVLKKSRLIHYAKPTDLKDPYPCNFHLQIGDKSDKLDLVVWNQLALTLHASLNVLDKIYVAGYKVGRAYGKPEGVEVSLNARNPVSIVYKLRDREDLGILAAGDEKDVAWSKRLPIPKSIPRKFELTKRDDVLLPDKTEVNLSGWLLYLSRPERVLFKPPAGFGEYRWVILENSSLRYVVKLFTSSQPDFYRIKPGDFIEIYNVLVASYTFDSKRPRVVYYVSSFTTHLVIVDPNKENRNLSITPPFYYANGFFQQVIPIKNIEELQIAKQVEGSTSFWQAIHEIKELALHQRKTFIVQGFIASVDFAGHFEPVSFEFDDDDIARSVVRGSTTAPREELQSKKRQLRSFVAGKIGRRTAQSTLEDFNSNQRSSRKEQNMLKRSTRKAKKLGHDEQDENLDSDDDGNMSIMTVNPCNQPPSIVSIETDLLPQLYNREEDHVEHVELGAYGPIKMRLASLNRLQVIEVVVAPVWTLQNAAPRGPFMGGFIDLFPNLNSTDLLLMSDQDLFHNISTHLTQYAGGRRTLVFQLEVFRASYRDFQVVLPKILTTSDEPQPIL